MILSIFLFFVFFALALFILGFTNLGEFEYSPQMFKIGSAFLIFMCGIIVLTQGLEFKSGSLVNVINSSSTEINYQYTTLSGTFQGSYGLSALLIVIGLALFLYAIMEIRHIKNNPKSYSEEED